MMADRIGQSHHHNLRGDVVLRARLAAQVLQAAGGLLPVVLARDQAVQADADRLGRDLLGRQVALEMLCNDL